MIHETDWKVFKSNTSIIDIGRGICKYDLMSQRALFISLSLLSFEPIAGINQHWRAGDVRLELQPLVYSTGNPCPRNNDYSSSVWCKGLETYTCCHTILTLSVSSDLSDKTVDLLPGTIQFYFKFLSSGK
jgi:hypothetical protein